MAQQTNSQPVDVLARAARLSDAQVAALRNVANGMEPGHGLRGRSAFGGLEHTVSSLERRGLIDYRTDPTRLFSGWEITDAGRAALARVQGGAA